MTEGPRSDPARAAYASPEPPAPTDPVYVVGIGPGAPEYLTPIAGERIREADVVLGFESVLEYVDAHAAGTVLACSYETESELLGEFATRVEEGAAGTVVMMGDPNVSGYQFLGKVERATDSPLRVLPGISSVQVAASRARTPLEDTTIVTLHKRDPIEEDLDLLFRDAEERHLLVLPRPYDLMPPEIATRLLDRGVPESLRALVFERLTHEDERVTDATLGELANGRPTDGQTQEFSDLSVLVVRRDAS